MSLVVNNMEIIELLKAYETLMSHGLLVQLSNLGARKNKFLFDGSKINSIDRSVDAHQHAVRNDNTVPGTLRKVASQLGLLQNLALCHTASANIAEEKSLRAPIMIPDHNLDVEKENIGSQSLKVKKETHENTDTPCSLA